MAILVSIPILGLLLMFQSAVMSRIPLLHGTADLVFLALAAWALQKQVNTAWHWGIVGGLMVSAVSALPPGSLLAGYLLTVWLALELRKRVWQVPVLAMVITVISGTVIIHAISLVALRITGVEIEISTAFNLFTLPSILLNLLLAIPTYALLGDLASWLYPEELEV